MLSPIKHRNAWPIAAICLALLILLLPESSPANTALHSRYIHQVWKVEDGLPQNTITAIAQTGDGYIWLGTRAGLVRFNGKDFKVFNSSNTAAFSNNYVFTLLSDSRDRLWIGTYGGGLLLLEDDRFTSISTRDGLADDVVWSIFEDSWGTVWVGTGGNGISRIRDGQITSLSTDDGLGSDLIWTFTEDENGSIWAGSDGDGPIKFTGDAIDNNPLPDNRLDYILSSYTDSKGNTWFGTAEGLLRYDGNELVQFSEADGLAGNIVWSISEDSQGNLLVGTEGGGLSMMSDGEFLNYDRTDGLGSDLVTDVIEDLEGNIWVGCKGGGLNRLSIGSVTTFTEHDGLLSNTVITVFEDSQGRTWFGTQNGGLSVLDKGKMTSYTSEQGLTSDIVISIVEDHNGHIWIGTDGGGLNHIEPDRIINYTTANGLNNNVAWSLTFDRDSILWIGTDGGGLNLLNESGFTYFDYSDGIESEFISATLESRNEGLWIGTRDLGLYYFDDGFTRWDTSDGLLDNVIWSIYEDEGGTLWVGTSSGLNRLDSARNIFSYTSEASGLPDNMIYGIVEDDFGYLWMSSNMGIFRIEKNEFLQLDAGKIDHLNVRPIGVTDGMISTECSNGSPSAWRAANGDLLFPTVYGAIRINPDLVGINERPPPIYIEELNINGISFGAGSEIRTATGEGKIDISYAALSYRAPNNNQYKYRLKGHDSDWIEAHNRNKVFYTNIRPGRYVFEVIGSNNDGIWNETGAAVEIILVPPFYLAWWFLILAVIVFVLLVVLVIQMRLRRLIKHENMLKRLVKERTQSLEKSRKKYRSLSSKLSESNSQKKLLLDIITHDLLNPLSVINNLAEIVQEKYPDDEAINIIRFSTDKILEVMVTSRTLASVSAGDRIKMEEIDLTGLIKSVSEEFTPRLESTGISLEINLPPVLTITANSIISAVFRNYISNAIKYADDGKRIIIDSTEKDGFLIIRVKDFGTTISKENRLNVFKRSFQVSDSKSGRGLGLSIVKRIAASHDAVVGVEPNEPTGNIFYIKLPI